MTTQGELGPCLVIRLRKRWIRFLGIVALLGLVVAAGLFLRWYLADEIVTDERLLVLLQRRENQVVSIWRGEHRRHITDTSHGGGGGDALEFRGGSMGRVLSRAMERVREDPLVFLPLLDSSDPETVLTAVFLLEHAGDVMYFTKHPEAAELVSRSLHQKSLTHRDARIRWQAMRLTYQRGWTEVSDVELGYSDTCAAVRQQAIHNALSLPNMREHRRELVGILIKHLNDEDFQVRFTAALQLRQIFSIQNLSGMPPGTPGQVDWVRADWKARESARQAWDQWWKDQGETYVFAEPASVRSTAPVTKPAGSATQSR